MNTVMLVLLGSAVLISIVAVFHALQDDLSLIHISEPTRPY